MGEKDGYTFDGWFTSLDDGDKVTDDSTISINKNHTLYAMWTFNIYDLNLLFKIAFMFIFPFFYCF